MELLAKDKPKKLYNPTPEESKIISAVWKQWQQADQDRQSALRFFNDRTLAEYVGDSVDRFNGYIEPRTDPAKDWGAKVFNNVTRNKTIAIIAQITNERVRGEFFAQNMDDEDDQRVAELVKKLEDYTYYKNKDDEQQLYAVLEAAVKGTVVGYEGYKRSGRKIKEIESYNPDTGEIKWKEKTIFDWDDVYGEIIPLLDFYPGNIWIREMQKQPFVIWRTLFDWDVFQLEFGKYKNAQYVQPSQELLGTERVEQSTTTDQATTLYVSDSLLQNQVEVIRYFNKWTDEFHILANGVLLTNVVSPMPWDHKDFPFWSSIFEPFAIDCFYGKSLPDKLKSNQDVLNVLYRLGLDQQALATNPPIMTTGIENVRDESLWPGKRLIVDDKNNSEAMVIPGPSQSFFNIMKMVEDNMNKSAIDDPSSGSATSRTTAFEVGIANDAAKKLLSLFLKTLEYGVRDKTILRVKNILQFYRLPKVKDVTSEEDAMDYRRVIIDNTELSDGSVGRQVVQIVGSQAELPPTDMITKMELGLMKQGQNVAFSFITTQKLKNIDLLIKIIPNSSIKMSEAMQRVVELDYQKTINTFYPDLVDRQKAFEELSTAFQKDPKKLIAATPQMPAPPGTAPAGGNQPNALPRSGPSVSSPNSMAAAGAPVANTTANSNRNLAAR